MKAEVCKPILQWRFLRSATRLSPMALSTRFVTKLREALSGFVDLEPLKTCYNRRKVDSRRQDHKLAV